MRAHRRIVGGGPLRYAALAGGYPDQFSMSNSINRIMGIRPSQLRNVAWDALVDVWVARQRERGALTDAPTPVTSVCVLCGTVGS
jgi:hypothetical protein